MVIAIALLFPAAALAQDLEPPSPRQGYYLGGGLFSLTNTNIEDGDNLGTWGGGGANLRLGQMVTRRLGLGLLIDQGISFNNKETAILAGLSVEAQWKIWRTLAVRGGTGIGFVILDDGEPDRTEEDAELRGGAGGYYLLGLSYDLFPYKRELSGGFSISPTVMARFLSGGGVDSVNVFFGFDFLWWTGLAKDQLDLPPEKAFVPD
jgi:hypothetical protein